ncbi:MAG: hypothetical protein BGO55_13575 [Sphingobacteriales bacterium 50-39]|nr:MAG: hypothetical protein BGO55_13575 [Sphingobacteriales bacterium 50-39]
MDFLLSMKRNKKAPVKNVEGTMEVGVAQVDITPATPIRLSGFAARAKSETDKVIRKLYAKALALGSDAQGPSLLITVDLIGIQWRTTSRIVELLAKKMGIRPAQIAICVTHTHGSPEVGCLISHLQCRGDYPNNYHFSDSLLELDQLIHIAQYTEGLVKKLEEVALAALKNRKPALVAWGRGQAFFAENRRTVGGPVDLSLPVLRVTSPDGTLRAVWVNYACHGIALGPDVNAMHGDWMGAAQEAIETKHPGAIVLVSIGCAGDSHPRLRDKMEYIKVYGQEISDSVDKLLKSKLQFLTKPPVGRMKWVKLPFAKTPTVPELIEQTKDTGIKGYYARLALDRIQRGAALPTALNYLIQTWQFGNKMLMINLGGEVVADYSVRLRKELKEDSLWMNAYTNDVSCYIASRRVIKEGGYEADTSMYWYDQPSPFSEEIEAIIIDAIKEITPAVFKKKERVWIK